MSTVDASGQSDGLLERRGLEMLGLQALGPGHGRLMRQRTMPADFTIQFIQRVKDLVDDLATAGRETVHPRRLGALRFRRAKPAALGHSRQHRIQRTWTQAIAVALQFFEHPLTIDALLGGVVEDVDLPKGEKELAHDRIAHDRPIIALPIRSRYSITSRDPLGDPMNGKWLRTTGYLVLTALGLAACRNTSSDTEGARQQSPPQAVSAQSLREPLPAGTHALVVKAPPGAIVLKRFTAFRHQ